MSPAGKIGFAPFELDPATGELWREGNRLHLQEMPFRLLVALLERPGEVVSREELRARLWPDHTFVDFDHNINVAVSKLREALGDSAESPIFIETLPKRGYRFIAPTAELALEESSAVRGSFWTWRVSLFLLFLVPLLIGKAVWWRDSPDGAASIQEVRSIAVLPFENISRDPEAEYLVDGITMAIIGELGKIQALRVISWQSVVQFRDSQAPLPEIAYLLDVDAVVLGDVLRSGSQIRVGMQLVAAEPERLLWAETYEQHIGEVLDIERDVARTVAREIRVTVTPAERSRLIDAGRVTPEAHDAYLKGLYHWNRFTNESLRLAVEYLEQAVALDPAYAAAYSALADSWSMLSWYGYVSPQDGFPRAEVAARRALELGRGLAAAHNSVAAVLYAYRWEFSAADRHHERAIQLNPSFALARNWYSWSLADQGGHEEALAQIRTAQRLDPLSLVTNSVVGIRLYDARRFDEAIEQLHLTLEMDPHFLPALIFLGMAYQAAGRPEEAIGELREAVDLSGGQPIYEAALAASLAAAGRREDAEAILVELLVRAEAEYVPAFQMAILLVDLGRYDQAFSWLERAFESRSPWMCRLAIEPLLDPIRSDPRFVELLRRTGRRT
jgi:TolB-like protein/DNA-binding winged helix-turn-helix (wHTH) protein/Tfp pilus assembly protein PilF